MDDSRGHRVFAALLAVLGPLLMLGACFALLDGFKDADDAMAARNAGRILNAKVLQGDAAQVMDRMLAVRDPDVLILGPSYANTNVRPAQLASLLGVPADRVLLLSVPNSVGAHWYTILKYRVFEAGYTPKLVVVVSGLQSMLLTTPLTESSYVNLRVQLPEAPDPVVQAKVQGSTGLLLARIREQRGKLREALFSALRYRPVMWLVRDGTGTMLPGEARIALDKVFDDSRIDMRLHGSAIPVVEASREGERFYTADMLPTPEESFLGDISALAASHGSRVVWVRPPMSPHIPAHLDDVVLPGVQEAAAELVEAQGASFVDMRWLPMTSAMFKNEDHMNEDGSKRFTAALSQALLELDALTPGARPGALPPLEASVEVEGPTDPPPAEAALAGPGRWLGPGSRVVYHLPEAWESVRGAFHVAAVVEALQARPPPVLQVAGADVGRFEVESLPDRVVLRTATDLAEPTGPFDVVVEVPEDAGWVRVVGLSLGRRLGRTFLEGDAAALDGRSVDLLGTTRIVSGTLEDRSLHPTYLAPPGPVPAADRGIIDLPGPLAAFPTAAWPFLSDDTLQGETTWGSRCSPLRVTEDGTLLPDANVPCLEVVRKGHGRSCHTTDRLYFTASDGTDPGTNGRTYRMVLDEGRRCDGAVWLYPRDHFQLAFPPERLAELPSGASWFTLGARYLQYREAYIHVKLLVDGVAVIDEQVPSKELKKDPRRVWRLDPPLPAGATDVVLDLENLDYTFHLVSDVELSERRPD